MQSVGRYRIEREIGRGAMGVVYLGMDPAIKRPVAIKTLNMSLLASEPGQEAFYRERLFREARLAAQLSHPNIVKLYDALEVEGLACLILEYVDGTPLDRMAAAGPLPRRETLSILAQLASALDYAHQNGIVHRDIKPGNVLVNSQGVPKLADFGVARIVSRKTTVTANALGTPGYMAPEQILDQELSGRTDQFALGVVAFELITGRKPFDSDSFSALVYKILQEKTPPSGCGPAVDHVLGRALAKEAGQRYPICTEFVSALEQAFLAPSMVPTAAPRPAVRQASWGPLIAVVVSTLIVLGAWRLWQIKSEKTPAPKAPVVTKEAPKTNPSITPQPTPVPSPAAPGPAPVRPPAEAAKPKPQTPKPQTPPQVKAPVLGRVQVTTTPPGARLVFNNDPLQSCTSPCERDLPHGSHTVSAALAGFRDSSTQFQVPDFPKLSLILDRLQGTVAIDASLKGALVDVDGKRWPSPGPTEIPLDEGSHHVKVEVNGVVVLDRVLNVKSGGRILVRAPAAR
jgi:serine/threonine-protein kinase